MDDAQLKEKFEDADKQALESAVSSALSWLDGNHNAQKEEFEAKQKEVEAVANPIMMKVYQGAGEGGAGMPDMGAAAASSAGGEGMTVEEVD